jgi:hypothetical protein
MSDNRDTYTVKAPHGTSADSIRTGRPRKH